MTFRWGPREYFGRHLAVVGLRRVACRPTSAVNFSPMFSDDNYLRSRGTLKYFVA